MKIRGSTSLHGLGLNGLLLVSLVLSLGSTGCSSFLRTQGMKDYQVKIKPADGVVAPNDYQADFLYLKALGEEVFPLEDHYFPPEKRASMEREILQTLGQPGCSRETFYVGIRRYLSAFNNQHARVEYDPKPIQLNGLYPLLGIHYVSNELYVLNIPREYDHSLIGQKIIAINDQPVAEVEQKLFAFVNADNPWTKRTSLEAPPCPFSRPDVYRLVGLTSSVSNSIKVEFAGHAPVWMAPIWQGNFQWQDASPSPHPITAFSQHLYDCRIFPEQKFAYFQFNACFDKTAILDGLSVYVKPWVRPLARAYLGFQFHRKKPSDQLRGMYDPDRPVFKDYLAWAIRDINQQGITNLIIDLRSNGGGEKELGKQLVYHLTRRNDLLDSRSFQYNPEVFAFYDPKQSRKFQSWYLNKFGVEPPSRQLLPTPQQELPFLARITDPKSPYYVAPDRPVFSGNVIVLANQNTGSAASILVGLLQDNRLATIVGTTTGNNPTGPSNMTLFKLPRSGIRVSLPTEYFERAVPSNGDVLQPDHWVESSVADIKASRDAAFEKALSLFQPE